MICDFKALRNDLGLTQVEFAALSGISLPTIQNIEAGKANPSLDILQKALVALGMELKVVPPAFDVDVAILLGVPLVSNSVTRSFKPTKNLLKTESRKWVQCLKHNTLSERDTTALISFLCALKDYWPTFYKEINCSIFSESIEKMRKNGHMIKLRRIALANLSRYL